MGFQKGNSGKPKGAKNKRTVEWEEFGHELLTSGIDRAKFIMEKSNDKDFMFYLTNLLEYFKPKQQRTESTISINELPCPIIK